MISLYEFMTTVLYPNYKHKYVSKRIQTMQKYNLHQFLGEYYTIIKEDHWHNDVNYFGPRNLIHMNMEMNADNIQKLRDFIEKNYMLWITQSQKLFN